LNKEQKVTIIAVMIPCIVMGYAFIQVYMSHVEHEATFKVFFVEHYVRVYLFYSYNWVIRIPAIILLFLFIEGIKGEKQK